MAAELTTPAGSRAGAAPWATLLTSALAVGVWAWSQPADTAFAYDRMLVLRGEWWRLWTGHAVHFATSHLLWNLAVLLPAGVWAERLVPGRTRWLLALAPGVISGALLACAPTLARYGGLSGLASAVLALLAFTRLNEARADRWLWRGVLALLALKIVAEWVNVSPLFARVADGEIRAVPFAHLVGFACAAAVHFVGRLAPSRAP